VTEPYLAELNPEQRRAVEHGDADIAAGSPPLLIIAGAGSGKTNTLAHRVAHLIAKGADPRRPPQTEQSRPSGLQMPTCGPANTGSCRVNRA
jgi:DNA helicase-2/ATP-dependent DNA helicase PcrA